MVPCPVLLIMRLSSVEDSTMHIVIHVFKSLFPRVHFLIMLSLGVPTKSSTITVLAHATTVRSGNMAARAAPPVGGVRWESRKKERKITPAGVN